MLANLVCAFWRGHKAPLGSYDKEVLRLVDVDEVGEVIGCSRADLFVRVAVLNVDLRAHELLWVNQLLHIAKVFDDWELGLFRRGLLDTMLFLKVNYNGTIANGQLKQV